MSTLYVPTPGWPNINVLDDGDAASAAGIGAATFEALADRVAQLTHPKLTACGGRPFKDGAGRFSVDVDYNGLKTAVAAGDYAVLPLFDLVHGATITSLDLVFIPKTTARAGWPLGSPPILSFTRWAISPAAFPTNLLIASGTYVPVSQADYQDGKFKQLSLGSISEVVDTSQFLYTLTITDESGANAIAGGLYAAYRVHYA